MLLSTILQTKIPIIGLHTDDMVNAQTILQSIAQKPVASLIPGSPKFLPTVLYIAQNEHVTTKLYRSLADAEAQAVVFNPTPNPLIFEGGELRVPDKFIREYLADLVMEDQMNAVSWSLRGLSLKRVTEVVQLAMAEYGSLSPTDIRAVRRSLEGDTPGLTALHIPFDFYEMPKELMEWLETNAPYFPNPTAKSKLVPRGLLLEGPPGTGKTLASQIIANRFKVPLFHLDIPSLLNKYIGTSESRLASALAAVDSAGPCVLLLDEVDKLFSGTEGEGTLDRMLSQLLWWLQMHTSPVVTIMTTNDSSVLPAELYRAGRIDQRIVLPFLAPQEVKYFAIKVLEGILGKDTIDNYDVKWMVKEIGVAMKPMAPTPAIVSEWVKQYIKGKKWGISLA